MQAVAFVHLAAFSRSVVPRWALCLGLTFAVGAWLRALFPVRWSTRPHACLFTTPMAVIGSDMFDRFVAQSIEMSFGFLIAHVHATHLDTLSLPRAAALSRLLAWPICMAQCCCWVGEVTDNKLWHAIEESHWAFTFAMHAAVSACAWLLSRHAQLAKIVAGEQQALSRARGVLAMIFLLSVPYVHFMVNVDVPMYYSQYLADEAKGVVYHEPAVGLRLMTSCQHVADDWTGWSEDALWMSLYFGLGPVM